MKIEQIHLWFKNKYDEEKKAENELAIVVKEILNKLQKGKKLKERLFLKLWKIMQLCEKLNTAYHMDALVSSIKVL